MGLLDALFRRGSDRGAAAIAEASTPALDAYGDTDNHLYRKISDSKTTRRDLTETDHTRMIQTAYWLYDQNPFAHRIIDMIPEFIVGEGVTFRSESPQVQVVLENFWNDPVNRMEMNQERFLRDLSLAGEQFYPVARTPSNGHVRLGYIDPERVQTVWFNPDNALIPEWIIMKTKEGKLPHAYQVVHHSTHPNFVGKLTIITEEGTTQQDSTLPKMNSIVEIGDKKCLVKGSVLYFDINRPLSGTRGRSDLLPLMDWLDAYDQFMFARLERVKHMGDYTWKALFKGKTEAELQKLAKNWPQPKPNSVWLHNDNMDLDAVTPRLTAEDASGEAMMFKNQILGGSAFPPTWFAESISGTANASEMNEPAFKRLLSRQRQFIHMLEMMFKLQVDQAVIANRLRPNISKTIHIDIPDLTVRDNQRITASISRLVESIDTILDLELLDHDESEQIVRKAVKSLGFDLGTNVDLRHKDLEQVVESKQKEEYRFIVNA